MKEWKFKAAMDYLKQEYKSIKFLILRKLKEMFYFPN